MKTKFTKKGRRILSAALCLLMMITALPMSAFAWTSEEGKSCTSSFGSYLLGYDGKYYYSMSDYPVLIYNADGTTYIKRFGSGNAHRRYLLNDNNEKHQVYCIESGVDLSTGDNYLSVNGNNSIFKTCRLTLSSVL